MHDGFDFSPSKMDDPDTEMEDSCDALEGFPVTASLGPAGPLIKQLRLLTTVANGDSKDEIQTPVEDEDSKDGIQMLAKNLEALCISLMHQSEAAEPSFTARCWMSEVRELCYDTKNYLDDAPFSISKQDDDDDDAQLTPQEKQENAQFEFQMLAARVKHASKRMERYGFDQQRCISKPKLVPSAGRRRLPVSFWKLILIDGHPFDNLAALIWRKDEGEQLKVVSLVGVEGVGKTTLAKRIYHHVQTRQFDCGAFVRVSPNPDMRRLLTTIFTQIQIQSSSSSSSSSSRPPAPARCMDAQDLITNIQHHLLDKRYLIIIDDLWSASVWDIIRRAFPDNGCHSRIITTTQFEDVASACCSYQSKYISEIKPLKHGQSQELFFSMFGSESEVSLPKDFGEVSDEIIQKCGGLPLSIVNIASMLPAPSKQNLQEWMDIRDSLPSTLRANPTPEGIKQVLNLIYNNLTPQLKTCLLYLVLYPEGCTISKDDLAQQWIVEGIIEEGQNKEEVAGGYFDELVSRGMIQVVDNYLGVLSCTLHHMVYDLIAKKSVEENFIIVVDYSQPAIGLPPKVRRLSVQFRGARSARIPAGIMVSEVRSLAFFGFCGCTDFIEEYKLLRVLVLHVWDDQGDATFELSGISNLLALRYLKIECNTAVKLPVPAQFGDLQHLEVDTPVLVIPSDIGGLGRLSRLKIAVRAISMEDIRILQKLEALSALSLHVWTTPVEMIVFDKGGFLVLKSFEFRCPVPWLKFEAGSMSCLRNLNLCFNAHEADRHGTATISIEHLPGLKEIIAHIWVSDTDVGSTFRAVISNHSSNPIIDMQLVNPIFHGDTTTSTGTIKVEDEKKQVADNRMSTFPRLKRKVNLLGSSSCVPVQGADKKPKLEKDIAQSMSELEVGSESEDMGTEHSMPSSPTNNQTDMKWEPGCEDANKLADIRKCTSSPGSSSRVPDSDLEVESSECPTPHPPLHRPPGSRSLLRPGVTWAAGQPRLVAEANLPLQAPGSLNSEGGQAMAVRETAVSIVTGAINPVVDKLTGLLADEASSLVGKALLGKNVKLGIQYMRDELSSMRAVLLRLSAVEEHMDPLTKQWMERVQDMSFEIEDCIDRFVEHRRRHGISHSQGGGLVSKVVRKLKSVWDDLQTGQEIEHLKAMVAEESERRKRNNDFEQFLAMHQPRPPVPLDPGLRTQDVAARNLVGMDAPREKIFGWLAEQDTQPKVVAIYGIGGSGKTTLALEVYNKIQEPFDCRAFVAVSQTPDIKAIFKHILFQVISEKEYNKCQTWDLDQMRLKLRKHLKNKRYLIVIDDVWTSSTWQHVKSALPIDNDKRSRIIATTRSQDVARSCCADMDGHVYEAKLLTDDDSRSLFFGRIFPSGECCPQELTEVANEILKKCAGLPLAIISIGSLLASKSRTVEVWLSIRNSVSSATERDSPLDQMKRILLLSYFDLPHHLRTCLLYLAVFPEDYYIDCRSLIWRWIAEGLINGENTEDKKRLGESYLNELINRSLIQAKRIGADGTTVKFCGVHDIVLEFIASQALEEKFVTVLNDGQSTSEKVRRLSLHLDSSQAADLPIEKASHLRSLYIFGSGNLPRGKQLPPNCEALRVLNIEGALNSENCYIEHIGSFHQLKYLRIIGEEYIGPRTVIEELPEQIGNLHHLEVLDIRGCLIKKLPATIVQLKKLVCLFLHGITPLPDGIGDLQCLEELSQFWLCGASVRSLEGLGELTKLRTLEITWGTNNDYSSHIEEDRLRVFASSLFKLVANSLRSLRFTWFHKSDFLNSWVFPSGSCAPPIQRLVLYGTEDFEFPAIPSQISSLTNLTSLRLSRVREMGEDGVNILASLPMLLSLTLRLGYGVRQTHVISSQGFRRLVKLNFCGETCLTFEAGAMPNLQRLKLVLSRPEQYNPGGFVQGLLHLSSLKHMSIFTSCTNTERVMEDLMNEIRNATSNLPNHPILVDKY